jgi:hypothetical protein
MNCAIPHTRLRISAALALAAVAIATGCTTTAPPLTAPVTTASGSASLVFSSEPVRNWHASNADQPGVGLIAADRYEYARNDARLSPGSRGPLLATRQWPEPPQPVERPVRFWKWRQR